MRKNIFFNTEVSYTVRDMCKDMDAIKYLLGLKPSHEHKRNCKPREILEGVKAAIFAPGVTVSVSTKGDGVVLQLTELHFLGWKITSGKLS